MAVHKNKVKRQTLGTTKLQTGRRRKRPSPHRDDRQLFRMTLNNCRMTSSDPPKKWQTAAGVKCTARTVRHRLLGAGLKSCEARKKPFINERQRRARLRFAKDHKDRKVIFSDESNFQLFPTPGRLMVRRRPGEAYKPQCLPPIVKFGGGSVMIWGCFSKAGIGQICLSVKDAWIKPGTKLYWKKTCFLLLWQCSPTLRSVFFQQDNSPELYMR